MFASMYSREKKKAIAIVGLKRQKVTQDPPLISPTVGPYFILHQSGVSKNLGRGKFF